MPKEFPNHVDRSVDQNSGSDKWDMNPERDGWPTPKPLSGTLPEVPGFDPNLLPESLRDRVVDLAERFQVPVDYPAAALIGMLAGTIGRRAQIRPKQHDDWVVYPNLWGAIVGRSGVMKTPLLNAVMGALRRREALAMTIYESELDEYERQKADFRARKRSAISIGVGRSPDSDSEREFDTEVPQAPLCSRYIVNDASVEKLHLLLKDNPAGLMYIRDELSGWIARGERERAFLLEAWDGNGEFTFDRIRRGTVHASHLCLSVFGGIQPARLQDHVAEAAMGGAGDDGLIQRFQLLVWPDVSREWNEIDRQPDIRAERQVEEILDRILQLSPEDPFRTRFSPEAQERFGIWRRELERNVRGGNLSPALESHLAKCRSLLPKLALIFNLAESGAYEIPLTQAERAAQLCAYLEAHARRLYGSVTNLPQRLAASLGQKVRSGAVGERFSLRSIYLHGWVGLDTTERARMAVGVLTDAGWVRRNRTAVGASGGRPSEEYVVNPAVFNRRN